MKQKLLDSGWILLWISGTSRYGGWAQIPPGFIGEKIPDEYIFEPEWNRDRVNTEWLIELHNKCVNQA